MGFFKKAQSTFNVILLRQINMSLVRFFLGVPVSFLTKSKTREMAIKTIRCVYLFWVFLNLTSVFIRANKLLGHTTYPIQHTTLDVNWQNRNIGDALFRLHYSWYFEETEKLLQEALLLESVAFKNGKLVNNLHEAVQLRSAL